MKPTRKPNLLRIVIWSVYFVISILLVGLAGGFTYLSTKSTASLNIPVIVIAGLVALFSVARIYFELKPRKVREEISNVEETPVEAIEKEAEDFKLCVHCGKAEPLDAVYCSSCGGRFP
jgi:ribosomal protein L40E